jgi:threonylcarbamoyladenosine tRNA methylthiotransferase MtaB
MNVFVQSLGCRLNQSEAEALARQFATVGYTVVSTPERADLCVVNTCAVTAEAAHKSRRAAGALNRANPGARIAMIGCYATLAPEQCARLPNVGWALSNEQKVGTVACVARVAPPAASPMGNEAHQLIEKGVLHTRAFVKVQDGCDNRCTYCVTRVLRGPARSRAVPDVVAEVHALAQEGYGEAVLTGVNLAGYGRDLNLPGGLRTLVETLLTHTDIPRLRLSSLEPWDLDDSFLTLWPNPRLCRQLHLPLQSGCDTILRRMRRPITLGAFAELVALARAAVPDLAVTTDIIVGFPGEDERAFRASCEAVEALAFSRLHVFRYSPRPMTAAARMPDQVKPEVARVRALTVRRLGREQADRFRQRFLGRELIVLWERARQPGMWAGLTDNYLRVVTRAGEDLHNRFTATRLLTIEGQQIVGDII